MFEGLLVDSGLPSTSLRLSNAYGPGQPARPGQGVVASWLAAAVAGRPLHIIGDGEAVRDFVFIDDVAGAIVAACTSDDVPPVVNVGSGQPTRLRKLAEIVLAAVADPVLELTLDPGRPFDVAATWLDVSLARTALGDADDDADGRRRQPAGRPPGRRHPIVRQPSARHGRATQACTLGGAWPESQTRGRLQQLDRRGFVGHQQLRSGPRPHVVDGHAGRELAQHQPRRSRR